MEEQTTKESPDEQRCSIHGEIPAVARCVSCGRFLCKDCVVLLGNRYYCHQCAYPLTVQQPEEAGPTFPDATWKITSAIVIFIVSFGAGILFEYLLYFSFFKRPGQHLSLENSLYLGFIGGIFTYLLLTGMTFYSVKVRHKQKVSALGLRLKNSGGSILGGVGAAVLAFFAAIFVSAPIIVLLKKIERKHTSTISTAFEKAAHGGVKLLPVLLLAVMLVIIAPVCEEIFFRGYLFPPIRNRMAMVPAMLISGLLFGIAHISTIIYLSIFALISHTLFGFAMCYVYEKKKTLIGPMAGHAFINGSLIVIALLVASHVH
jgi:membrane protease YdiL (CAAX protease family)